MVCCLIVMVYVTVISGLLVVNILLASLSDLVDGLSVSTRAPESVTLVEADTTVQTSSNKSAVVSLWDSVWADVGVWLSSVVVSSWLRAVPVSLPVSGAQTPAHSVLVGQGTTVITDNGSIAGTGWGNIVRGLGSLARPSVVHVEVDGTWVGDSDGVEVADSGSSSAGSWDGGQMSISSLDTEMIPAHVVLIGENSSLLWAVIGSQSVEWGSWSSGSTAQNGSHKGGKYNQTVHFC